MSPEYLSRGIDYLGDLGANGLSTITDPMGRVTTVTVQANKTLTALQDPDLNIAGGYRRKQNGRGILGLYAGQLAETRMSQTGKSRRQGRRIPTANIAVKR